MVHGLLSSGSLHWVNLKEPSHKVNEHVVITVDSLLKSCLLGHQDMDFKFLILITNFLLSLRGVNSTLTLLILIRCLHVDESLSSKEVADKFALLHHILWDWADDSNHSGEKSLHRVILEEDIAGEELSQDAAKGPHVDLVVVFAPKDDFWCSVRSTLHVGAQMVVDEATRSKINYLDLTSGIRFDQDILGLQVTMDQVEVMDKVQGIENLLGYFLKSGHIEIVLLFNFSIVFGILIKIISE